jgi:predicted phosphodiesterase
MSDSWPSDADLQAIIRRAGGNVAEVARELGRSRRTVGDHIERQGLKDYVERCRETYMDEAFDIPAGIADEDEEHLASVYKAISGKKNPTVEELADEFDTAPRNIRSALGELSRRGYRVDVGNKEDITLLKVAPTRHIVHKSLLSGTEFEFGLVSDTHLSSNEQALEHLELAYDVFEERGITEVYHPGDFTAGVGIFPQQHSAIFNHTYEDQVEYLVANYPRRAGITTRGVTGNHDIEGGFGRIGANPVLALANRRDDIEFLGDYSAYVELPGGSYLHLLHGKGSMSYAYSYKAQKLVDGYPAGRKPAILAVGHWHVHGTLEHRGVQVIFPGCFEWQSPFMERLALQPAVGFHVVRCTVGDDGSLVKFVPEWHRFYEGRVVTK